jgi:2-amino-4-hydroxy-6-hydroxymethyldihydropteridine diphosphokinase
MMMKSDKKHIVYISAGSNIGDKMFNCRMGFEALESTGTAIIKSVSRYYKTEPVDFTAQDWFVNAAACIETQLSPVDLLYKLKSIEKAAGRRNGGVRFGPRIIDLDIILYDDDIMESEEVVVPHPRMHRRCFVLRPICDIAPDVMHPVLEKSMRTLLEQLNLDGQKIDLIDD